MGTMKWRARLKISGNHYKYRFCKMRTGIRLNRPKKKFNKYTLVLGANLAVPISKMLLAFLLLKTYYRLNKTVDIKVLKAEFILDLRIYL